MQTQKNTDSTQPQTSHPHGANPAPQTSLGGVSRTNQNIHQSLQQPIRNQLGNQLGSQPRSQPRNQPQPKSQSRQNEDYFRLSQAVKDAKALKMSKRYKHAEQLLQSAGASTAQQSFVLNELLSLYLAMNDTSKGMELLQNSDAKQRNAASFNLALRVIDRLPVSRYSSRDKLKLAIHQLRTCIRNRDSLAVKHRNRSSQHHHHHPSPIPDAFGVSQFARLCIPNKKLRAALAVKNLAQSSQKTEPLSDPVLDLYAYTSLIDLAGRCGNLDAMESLFAEISRNKMEPACATFSCMMRAYMRHGRVQAAEALWSIMQSGKFGSKIQPDEIVFSCVAECCARTLNLTEAKRIMAMYRRANLMPNSSFYGGVLLTSVRCKDLEFAWMIIEEACQRNCTLPLQAVLEYVKACKERKNFRKILQLLAAAKRYPSCFSNGSETEYYSPILEQVLFVIGEARGALAAQHFLQWVLEHETTQQRKTGWVPSISEYNSLVRVYGCCCGSTHSSSHIDNRVHAFPILIETGVNEQHVMIESAFQVVQSIIDSKSFQVNLDTFHALFSVCVHHRDSASMRKAWDWMLALKLKPALESYHFLIEASESSERVLSVLNEVKRKRSVSLSQESFDIVFKTLMTSSNQVNMEIVSAALSVMIAYKGLSIEEKRCVISKLFVLTNETQAQSANALLELDALITNQIKETYGFELDLKAANLLLDAYRRAQGKELDPVNALARALSVFARMPSKNALSFNLMIFICIRASKLDKAIEFIQEMYQHGYLPANIAYAQIVDGYSRNGQIDKAMELLDELLESKTWSSGESMDGYLISSILSVCGKHDRMDIVESVFGRLDKSRCNPSHLAAYNAMIYVCGMNSLPESHLLEVAFSTYNQLLSHPVLKPDAITYSAMASVVLKHRMRNHTAIQVLALLRREISKISNPAPTGYELEAPDESEDSPLNDVVGVGASRASLSKLSRKVWRLEELLRSMV